MNNFKRITAAISAVMIVVSAASCGKGVSSKEAKTADKALKNSYRSETLNTDTDFGAVDAVSYVPASDKLIISASGYDMKTYETIYNIYAADADLSNSKKLELDIDKPANGSAELNFAFSDDGTIYTIACLNDYGDMKAPDWSSPDFDYESFDEDAFAENIKRSYKLLTFDIDGNKLSENDLDISVFNNIDDEIYFTNFQVLDDDDLIIGTSGMENDEYFILDTDGKLKNKLEYDELNWIDSVAPYSDGSIAIAGHGEEGLEIHFAAPDGSGENADPIIMENNSGTVRLMKGYGEYDVLVSTYDGLSGIKDGELTEVVNYLNSDLDPQNITAAVPMGDGEFIVVETDWSQGFSGKSGFSRLTARDMEEMKDTKIITLATLGVDSDVTAKVTEYNKAATGYRIQLEDYSKYNVYDGDSIENSAVDQLKKDILAGNSPDMIISYDNSILKTLAGKGAFADLYTFLENDSELSRDDIMPNILKYGEYDGKLYSLSSKFSIMTYVIKKKFCDHDGWTAEEFMDIYNNRPEGSKFLEYETRDSVLAMLFYGADKFIDYDNGKCNFSDPEFVKMLEFTKQFPEEVEDPYENLSEEESDALVKEEEVAFRNDKALVKEWYMYDLREYNEYKDGYFGEDISLVGVPSEDSNGALINCFNNMMIMNDSPSKDECWKFMKSFFDEKEFEGPYSFGIPSLVSAFDKKMDEAMERAYFTDENGKKSYIDDTMDIAGKEFKIDPLTKEQRDYVADYIKSSSEVRNSFPADVENIIIEELDAFYSGEKSAQEAVDMIQSRASILVSEQS